MRTVRDDSAFVQIVDGLLDYSGRQFIGLKICLLMDGFVNQ